MAQSPLSIYKEVLQECGVREEVNVPPVARLTYVQEQAQQQKAILNRLLFDLATAVYNQNESKDDTTKHAHRQKADGFRNDIRQIKTALEINLTLIDELRAEHKELQVEV